MSDYKFVTREEIERELLTLPPTFTGRSIRSLLGRLHAERDAYREGWINSVNSEYGIYKPEDLAQTARVVDAEALAILTKKNGEERRVAGGDRDLGV